MTSVFFPLKEGRPQSVSIDSRVHQRVPLQYSASSRMFKKISNKRILPFKMPITTHYFTHNHHVPHTHVSHFFRIWRVPFLTFSPGSSREYLTPFLRVRNLCSPRSGTFSGNGRATFVKARPVLSHCVTRRQIVRWSAWRDNVGSPGSCYGRVVTAY